MAAIHEQLGIVSEQLDTEIRNHRQTIQVLAGLHAGTIRPDQLTVDPAASKWTFTPDAPVPVADDAPTASD